MGVRLLRTPKSLSSQEHLPQDSFELLDSACRGICVSILPTTSSKAYQVIARSSEINVLVVDSSKQLQKISQVSAAQAKEQGVNPTDRTAGRGGAHLSSQHSGG